MEKNMIIDMHCHTAGIGAGASGCFVSPAMAKSWKYRLYLKAFGVSEEELRREGDRIIVQRLSRALRESHSVEGAVILALDGVVGSDGKLDRGNTEIYIPNDFVASETRRYENLFFGASVNPYRRDALEQLETAVAGGALLLKWLPSIQQIDPADSKIIPFYRRMSELGLPLLSHTGNERSFTTASNHFADPECLRLPLSLGVRVIAAHAGSNGCSCGEANHLRFVRLCCEFPNLYADISALTQMNRLGHVQRLLRIPGMAERLLYGSDMPLLNTAIVTPLAFSLRLSPLKVFRLMRMKSRWDQDIALKKALGVPQEVFGRSAAFLFGSNAAAFRTDREVPTP